MLLITAPSKTQRSQLSNPAMASEHFTLPVFFERSKRLNSELAKLSLTELCQLMKMSETLGKSTHQRISHFVEEPTSTNCLPALFTFQGDAYSSLTPESYDQQQLLHAQAHLRILSGLYGILRPLDLMSPYRLEMATRLQTENSANLYQFWGDMITENINEDLAGLAEPVVVNLASTEYSKVIHAKRLEGRMLTITFKEKKGDDYRTVPIHSKRARGMMIHFMITEQLTAPGPLRDFNLGGYTYRDDLSSLSQKDEWIFTRE